MSARPRLFISLCFGASWCFGSRPPFTYGRLSTKVSGDEPMYLKICRLGQVFFLPDFFKTDKSDAMGTATFQDWRLLLAVSFPLVTTWNGCASAGDSGVVWSRATLTAHALVVESYTLGCSVSAHPETGGLTLGWRHVAYIYPRKDESPQAWSTAGRLFFTHLPNELPLALISNSLGGSLDSNASHVGLRFGLYSRFATRVRVDRSQVIRFQYDPSRPAETVAQIEKRKANETLHKE